MKRFKSSRQVQCFGSIHDPIANLFTFRAMTFRPDYRQLREAAMDKWREIARGNVQRPQKEQILVPSR